MDVYFLCSSRKIYCITFATTIILKAAQERKKRDRHGVTRRAKNKIFIYYLKLFTHCGPKQTMLSENARKTAMTDDRNDLLEIM